MMDAQYHKLPCLRAFCKREGDLDLSDLSDLSDEGGRYAQVARVGVSHFIFHLSSLIISAKRPVVIFVTPFGTKCPKAHGFKGLARGQITFGTRFALWRADTARSRKRRGSKQEEKP